MSYDLTDAIVLITSADATNTYFGTGFVIRSDAAAAHVLTCAHVVVQVGGAEQVIAGREPAMVVAVGAEDGLDLAVLRVDKLANRPSLNLRAAGQPDLRFCTAGFQLFGKSYLIRSLEGTLGKAVGLESRNKANRDKMWDLQIDGAYVLQPGYSGSPVAGKQSDEVVAVVSHRQGQGERGLAVSIEGLKKIWPAMPAGLVRGIRADGSIDIAEQIIQPVADRSLQTSPLTARPRRAAAGHSALRRSRLEKELTHLTQEYEAVSAQYDAELNAATRLRLQKQMETLEQQIAKAEADRQSL